SAPRLIAEAKQTKSNTATRLRKLCNFLPSCAILRLIRWTNARMVTGILFFFIVLAKHHAQSSDQAGERVLVLLRILGSEVLEIFFVGTLVVEQSGISDRSSCPSISAVRLAS